MEILLDLIEDAGFEAFITNDKRMEREQNLARPFAVLVLTTNHWPIMEPNVGMIAAALDGAQPGTVSRVDCGRFVPTRFRKPGGSSRE